ncbi:MAG: hypothetical protein WBY53_15605 [Acidobacteriaceae bacterium]
MVIFIFIAFVAILGGFLVALAWGANARRRAGQSGASVNTKPRPTKIGRAPGPD